MGNDILFYTYSNCDTCRRAAKWLAARSIVSLEKPIRETPPSRAELKRMLGYAEGNVAKLFNVSGQEYRALDLKSRLPGLTVEEALGLMASNGRLIKRPFLLAPHFGLLGFKPESWAAAFGKLD